MIFWLPTAGLQWPPFPFHKILLILTLKEQTCLRLIPKNNRKSNKSFCSDMLCSHGQLSSSQWAYPRQKISLYLFWRCHTEQQMIFHLDPCNLKSNAFSLSLRPPFFLEDYHWYLLALKCPRFLAVSRNAESLSRRESTLLVGYMSEDQNRQVLLFHLGIPVFVLLTWNVLMLQQLCYPWSRHWPDKSRCQISDGTCGLFGPSVKRWVPSALLFCYGSPPCLPGMNANINKSSTH